MQIANDSVMVGLEIRPADSMNPFSKLGWILHRKTKSNINNNDSVIFKIKWRTNLMR